MSQIATFAPISYAVVLCLCMVSCVPEYFDANESAITAPLTTEERRARRIQQLSASWPSVPDYSVSFIALAPGNGSSRRNTEYAVFNPNDDYSGLPRTGEYEQVSGLCGACHSLEIVMQQRATPARWDYMLNWMTEEQGMPMLPQEDRDSILAYLSENFGP